MKPKKIILAIDSYKGCLSSSDAEDAAERAILDTCPDCNVVKIAVADGGEGTLDAVTANLGGYKVKANVSDPFGRPIEAGFGVADNLAIIESSSSCGLTLLGQDERNPMLTSTKGLGELLMAAMDEGCEEFIVGLGGSATNDGGRGMVEVPGLMERIRGKKITVACDVDNPFVGPRGASRVFAPQKGASPAMVEVLEKRLVEYAETILQLTGIDVRDIPGAGAAGGLGGAFKAFFGAELKSGINIILDTVNFDSQLDGTSLVITGEGCSDFQTLMGKCPFGVLQRAKAKNIPVVLMSGKVKDECSLKAAGFAHLLTVTPVDMPLIVAMCPKVARLNIIETLSTYLKNE